MDDSAADDPFWYQNRVFTKNISIYLTRRTTYAMSNIKDIRVAFDQVRPIVGYSELFTQKPLTPSDIVKCLNGLHRHNCISSKLFSMW